MQIIEITGSKPVDHYLTQTLKRLAPQSDEERLENLFLRIDMCERVGIDASRRLGLPEEADRMFQTADILRDWALHLGGVQ